MRNIEIKSWGNIFQKNATVFEDLKEGEKYITVGNQNSLSDCNIPVNNNILKLSNSHQTDTQDDGVVSSLMTIGNYIDSNKKFLYGIPGTPHVTFGGGIAADVHGKDAYWGKNFAANIESIKLKLSTNQTIEINRNSDFDIFQATIGGFGLTGQIISTRLKPNKIKYSEFFNITTKVGKGIDNLINEVKIIDDNYFLAVIDLVNKNDKWIIKRSSPIEVTNKNHTFLESKENKTSIYLPFVGSNFLYSLNLLNSIYPFLQKDGIQHYSKVLFPQGGIRDPRIFCKNKKIIEIQFSIPIVEINNIGKILSIIKNNFKPISCSLKILSKPEKFNNLSFCQEGIAINFDIPSNKINLKIIENLHNLLIEIGGKVNLSKDSLLNEKQFKGMYPEFKNWIKVVKKVDPNDNFQSSLSKRLGIK